MFKVYAEPGGHPREEDKFYICEVGSLEEADAVIAILEKRWEEWTSTPYEDEHGPRLPPQPDRRVAELEGTIILAVQDDGTTWIEDGPGDWRKL